MAGGLMNLVAYGNQNVILNGNPSKTFFKFVYSKYTNFGLQKFRIDIDGQRQLNMTQESFFTFKIPRYADLLMDTYLVVNLPNIWSPILKPNVVTSNLDYYSHQRPSFSPLSKGEEFTQWRPYEFKWIDNLGSQLIKEVTFSIGGQIIQKFSGEYLYNLVERDFRGDKKLLYYQMTGNTKNLNDPSNYNNNNGYYPNAWYESDPVGAEPSIRAQTLYIPINIWFTLASQMAFPLVALQYNQLEIKFTIRAVEDLFVVRDVLDTTNNWRIPKNVPFYKTSLTTGQQWINEINKCQKAPYVRPRQTEQTFQFYRFLSQPSYELLGDLDISGNVDTFPNKRTNWNADIHLIATYGFLSEDEVRVFAFKPQSYLIKEVYEWDEHNVVGTKKIPLDSLGMVSNWMFYLQRTDVINRNQWSNYSNWPYNEIPNPLSNAPGNGNFYKDTNMYTLSPCCPLGPSDPSGVNDLSGNARFYLYGDSPPLDNSGILGGSWWEYKEGFGPGTHPGYVYNESGIKITGQFTDENEKTILLSAAILLDGKYRENEFPVGIYNQIEKYTRTFGFATDLGLNCYNFALHSNPFDFQPSGAINLSKFNSIQFEINTYTPPLDPSAQTLVICDSSGEIIGINKPVWSIYKYTYNFKCFEERYNILKFINGNGSLAYAR